MTQPNDNEQMNKTALQEAVVSWNGIIQKTEGKQKQDFEEDGVNVILYRQDIVWLKDIIKAAQVYTDLPEKMDKDIKFLQDENEHLKRCLKESSRLQNDIILVGKDYLTNVFPGKTYSVWDAWDVIKQELLKTKGNR